MDSLIEVSKIIILVAMFGVAVCAFKISYELQLLTSPLARRLAYLHQVDPSNSDFDEPWICRIKQRYETLISHVDHVDAADFSLGEIETMPLVVFGKTITASSGQSWLRQSPGILISLGLLGTFFGLTLGLGQINGVLIREATPSQTMSALTSIVAPMSTAFQTSLLGLFLSLVVLIWSQANGTRNCLERCESLLSSWLETVLPQSLGSKVMTPLRKSIEQLNYTVGILPETLQLAIQESMNKAFARKLDQIFDANSSLAAQAEISIRQMTAISNLLNESGQDFVRAAQILKHSDFASSLHESVQGLLSSREFLVSSTNSLCERLLELREELVMTQSQWSILAKTAEKQLASCKLAVDQIQLEANTLSLATNQLDEAVKVSAEASKQLRETRLEVMRDRKLSIEVAEALRSRLSADSSVSESCKTFATALETCLNNWNKNVQFIDELHVEILKNSLQARNDDAKFLDAKKKEAEDAIDEIRSALINDVSQVVKEHQQSLELLDGSTRGAQAVSEVLLDQLNALSASIANLNLRLS